MFRHTRSWFILLALFLFVGLTPILFAQAADAAGVPVPADSANEWGGALVWAFFSSSTLEWLKRNKTLTILTEQTAWFAQRLIGVALAVAAAVGVHWSFDPVAGELVVGGLIWSSVWTLGTEAIRQWVLQELTYRTAVRSYHPQATT
jgi:hypothetical protein